MFIVILKTIRFDNAKITTLGKETLLTGVLSARMDGWVGGWVYKLMDGVSLDGLLT